MRSTGVHHVDLVVSSIERNLTFYRDLLGPLGFTRIGEVEGERGETIWYFGGPGSSVGLRQAQSLGGIDRYRIGLHHVALAWLFLRMAQEGELRQELLERGLDPRAVRRAVRYGRAQELADRR